MTRMVAALAGSIAAIAHAGSPARSAPDAGASGFRVRYDATPDPGHARLRAAFRRQRVFEQVAAGLNALVRVPTAVQIRTVDCGIANAFYDARRRRITICYELVDFFYDAYREAALRRADLDAAVFGTTLFTFYHEASHGLIDVLDLPATGREEDAADQLATLTLLAMGARGAQTALTGARWFRLQATQRAGRTALWDEHAADAQRSYNVTCLIYGSDPERYASFTTDGTLPRARASRCEDEYARVHRAWTRLLGPYFFRDLAPPRDQ